MLKKKKFHNKIIFLCYYKPFPTNSEELKGICITKKSLKEFFEEYDRRWYIVYLIEYDKKSKVIKKELYGD